jgi:hypothetical protein
MKRFRKYKILRIAHKTSFYDTLFYPNKYKEIQFLAKKRYIYKKTETGEIKFDTYICLCSDTRPYVEIDVFLKILKVYFYYGPKKIEFLRLFLPDLEDPVLKIRGRNLLFKFTKEWVNWFVFKFHLVSDSYEIAETCTNIDYENELVQNNFMNEMNNISLIF